MMLKLYKYLPKEFAERLLDGEVLFRNLIYFKRMETDPRNDIFEGKHVDAPDHDVEITVISTGRRIRGRFAFHNALDDMEKIFGFCTSLKFDADLRTKFGGECIEIS